MNEFQFRPDDSFRSLMQIIREDEESEYTEPKRTKTPQNMKTIEEPEADPEEMDLEDHDKDDFNQPGKQVKSKTPKNPKYAIKEVPEDKKQKINGSKNESKGDLYLCNHCFKTFRNIEASCTECLSNIVEKIIQESPKPEHEAEIIYGVEDKILGGKADKSKPEDFDPEQLVMGIDVEMEHTDDPDKAREIAMDHLAEDPEYYTKLKRMEAGKCGESKLKEEEGSDDACTCSLCKLRAKRMELEQQMLDSEKRYQEEQNALATQVDDINKQLRGRERPDDRSEEETV